MTREICPSCNELSFFDGMEGNNLYVCTNCNSIVYLEPARLEAFNRGFEEWIEHVVDADTDIIERQLKMAYQRGLDEHKVQRETLEQEVEVLKKEIYRLNERLAIADHRYRTQGELLKRAKDELEKIYYDAYD